eukprot:3119013-Amphidinium_carterae.2
MAHSAGAVCRRILGLSGSIVLSDPNVAFLILVTGPSISSVLALLNRSLNLESQYAIVQEFGLGVVADMFTCVVRIAALIWLHNDRAACCAQAVPSYGPVMAIGAFAKTVMHAVLHEPRGQQLQLS